MYSRFKALENYSEKDLEMLQNSTVAVVGLGATGSVIAESLARHGVNLTLIDRDYLEPNDCYSSNIYTPEQCEKSMPKAKAAEEFLSSLTEVEAEVASLNPENLDILEDADLVMDGTDNLETRFLISEYCRKNSKPWIYTSALGEKGYSMLFQDKCFNCIFDDINAGSLETCETSGIMREVSTIAASKSSMKAVKFLAGKEVSEKLETVGGEEFNIENPGCKVCRNKKYPHLDSERKTTAVCGENKYQVERDHSKKIFEKIKERCDRFTENSYLIRAEINGRSATFFQDGRAIIEAKDKGHAEAFYSEIVGV
ncbi:MAG: molybdopterin/thiamine biosynthesis adenylyltransferase [Candidatus Nanohaloarchaea archaeon]|jgi:molybdopterin/thiamine biosynthesis adenylyltransferase